MADAAVSLESAGGEVRSTRTAADGAFSFDGVAAGDYTLLGAARNCQPAGVRRRLSENVDLDVRVNDLFDELYATTYYWNVEPQWFLGMPRSAEVALLVGF